MMLMCKLVSASDLLLQKRADPTAAAGSARNHQGLDRGVSHWPQVDVDGLQPLHVAAAGAPEHPICKVASWQLHTA